MMRYSILLALSLGCSTAAGHADTVQARSDSARADSVARARQDSINREQPGYVIDSVHPPEEELRRFRVAVGGVPANSFSGGSESREALVQRFLDAISTRDTADLRKMVLSPREFVDL